MKTAPLILPAVDDWYALPSGRMVSVRRIQCTVAGEGAGTTEVVVRYLDDNAGMAQGDFSLTPAFLARCKKVPHG